MKGENLITQCAVCQEDFRIRRNAATADTQTLCPKCRRAMRQVHDTIKATEDAQIEDAKTHPRNCTCFYRSP